MTNETSTLQRTVLLVEDEAPLLAIVQRVLERAGYQVAAFTDAQSALAWATTAKYDLVLTDMSLPGGINGDRLAQTLHEGRPEIPIIFTSGEALADTHAACRFLPKPFSIDGLLCEVSHAFDSTRMPR